MITGRRAAASEVPAGEKSIPGGTERNRTGARPRWALGSALAVSVLGFWTWAVTTGGGPLLSGAEDTGDERGYGEHAENDDAEND
jgi:hypothetical protein